MATPGAVPASMAKRLLAAVIDGAAAMLLGGAFVVTGLLPVVEAVRSGSAAVPPTSPLVVVGYVLVLALAAFQWWFQGARGYTIGKRLVGLRTLAATTGRPIGLGKAFVRLLVPAAGSLACGVGQALVYASPFFDGTGRRQGWHDKAAGSMVFDVAVGVDPAEASASAPDVARRIDGLLAPAAPATPRPPVSGAPGAALPVGPVPSDPRGAVPPPPPPPPPPSSAPDEPRPGPLLAPRLPLTPPGAGAAPAGPPPAPAPAPAPAPVTSVPVTSVPVAPAPGPAGPPAPAPAVPDGTGIISSVPVATSRPQHRLGEPSEHDTAPSEVASAPEASDAALVTSPQQGVQPLPPLDDDVERTRLGHASRLSVPEVERTGRGAPRATLQLWDGRTLTLEGTALVGRNPAPRDGEAEPDQLLAVPDPGRSVSKTHLVLGVDTDGVWLRDRNSTNGTVVTLGDGQQILCAPEQKVRVPDRASVAFGDFWLTVAG
ncbi:RDD family protein [Actinotalea solisilvae]|uniref:RDD family protein n=1 Tax=Actinotalea solisilvae TaxID=2072922 RepID=UPI0018F15722|nr:RDD family protein [Actinotalea solisilvae]